MNPAPHAASGPLRIGSALPWICYAQGAFRPQTDPNCRNRPTHIDTGRGQTQAEACANAKYNAQHSHGVAGCHLGHIGCFDCRRGR
jgi:hypothetical protein